ncbi:RNA-binding transcriptional accessory protein [Ectothiorhodospiraceae bacterium 2226]|nr:RNA-binding transcriptional accessory protein [Ectothiorhodospiraceae bacterium 2226]
MDRIIQRLAQELVARDQQVLAAVRLLDEGATVPFIARYRKEATGGLDDTQLRLLDERLGYLRELEERRATVLKSIGEQGKLTPELERAIQAADTKVRLEDLYRPYAPKRRTKAQIAREAGLEPLAMGLLEDPSQVPAEFAAGFVNVDAGVADAAAALEGARFILMEHFADDAELMGRLREHLWEDAHLQSKVVAGQEESGIKFSDYFDASEPLRAIPSHRALALFRGRKEGVLTLDLVLPEDPPAGPSSGERMIVAQFGLAPQGRAADDWLQECVRWAWRVKILPHLDTELKVRLREEAEAEAIKVFGRNLNALLLAPPARGHAVIGLDPGLRTGVKVAVVDVTGKVVDTATIYPHAPQKRWDEALSILSTLAKRHQVSLIAIGNGTASRETERLAAELQRRNAELKLSFAMVSEAGASVYSASELAAREFPDLDVSLRGAVSIARRLQDPLAELVKIDPKSIGVGQYQHDVSQVKLARSLDGVVEDCVNAVGVDVNTASVPLLARVAGLSESVAGHVVALRDERGAFRSRAELREVPRLGDKTFEQAAGFLRINDGDNPLDASAVHPEAYPVVARILAHAGRPLHAIIGDSAYLRTLDPRAFADAHFGEPTVRDIIAELEKPGRDPRPEFKTATFREGVETLNDLEPGMILEGVVTNVTNFGAFVDIGVHQDGLVHVSALADRFVADPHAVVKTGQVVKVKVQEVDLKRRRISLTMRLQDAATQRPQKKGEQGDAKANAARPGERPRRAANKQRAEPAPGGIMAEAFARLKDRA